MKNAIRLSFFFLLLFLWQDCRKEENQRSTPDLINTVIIPHIEIEYALTCGWSTRADTLRISRDSIHLYQRIQGWGQAPYDTLIDTAFYVPLAWLDSLYYNLDMAAFQQLNYQSGNLPSDGCNVDLYLKKDNSSHAIQFNLMDSIPGWENYLRRLDSLWIEAGGVLAPGQN